MARSRENFWGRCEAFSILEQEFDEGFALLTVELGRQRVNVIMIRRSFVLVEIERVVLGIGRAYGLWPQASPHPAGPRFRERCQQMHPTPAAVLTDTTESRILMLRW